MAISDGTKQIKESNGDIEVNVIVREDDPEVISSETLLMKKKNSLASLGFSIKEFSEKEKVGFIGFHATKSVATDTSKRLSFCTAIVKKD